MTRPLLSNNRNRVDSVSSKGTCLKKKKERIPESLVENEIDERVQSIEKYPNNLGEKVEQHWVDCEE